MPQNVQPADYANRLLGPRPVLFHNPGEPVDNAKNIREDPAASGSRHWTDTFFTGDGLEVVHDPERERTAGLETDWIVQVLGLCPGDRVLDVPCGNGRIAAELARLGIRVLALDASTPLLRLARARCRLLQPPPVFRQADMRHLQERPHYQAALNWWGSFGYFDDRQNLAVLRCLRRALVPGGQVLVDNVNREYILRCALGLHEIWIGSTRIRHRAQWNGRTERLEGTWEIRRRGRTSVRHSSIRLYTPAQWRRLIAQAGLENPTLYGDWTGSPWRRGSPRCIVRARHPLVEPAGG
jgi:SAM-dependent methyltransferase